jgi:hypothetical protein
MRSLISVGWNGERLLYGFTSIGAVGLLSMTLVFTALSSRVRKR